MVVVSMLLYLIRILTIGAALGVLFIRCGLFKRMNEGQTILIGVGVTPMFVSLVVYLLGLVFIGWPSWFYVIVPFILAIIFLVVKKNYGVAINAIRSVFVYCIDFAKSLGAWLLLDGFLALCLIMGFAILYNCSSEFIYILSAVYHSMNLIRYGLAFLLAIVSAVIVFYFIKRMLVDGTFSRNLFLFFFMTVVGCSCFLGISMNSRPTIDSDRSHYELEARYFLEDKNSWEVDNYTDEKYGSSLRDDHGPLWIMDLADAKLVADVCGLEDNLRTTNFAIFWTYCCFYLLLFISASFIAGTYKAGVVSFLLFSIYKYEIMMIEGSRDAFRFVGLQLLFIYVCNQFEEIVNNRAKWYHHIFMLLFCYLSMNGHEGNVYVMLGMFIVMGIMLLINKTPFRQFVLYGTSVLAGTILGITKTISLYLTTGNMTSTSKLVFHDTPVIDQLIEINAARADWNTIWASYTKPVLFVMLLGMFALIIMIVVSWIHKDKKVLTASLLIFGMLLPLTGVMDWIGYECSRWFLEQYRYRMYFLMLLSMTGSWLLTRKYDRKILTGIGVVGSAFVFALYGWAKIDKSSTYNKEYVRSCITVIENYKQLANTITSLTDGNAFTHDQVLLYYLHGTPKLLYHMYTEDLIQAKTDEEIETAIEKLGVGAILLPENGLAYHDYSLLPFWNYINENENFSQLRFKERDDGTNWVIFYHNE